LFPLLAQAHPTTFGLNLPSTEENIILFQDVVYNTTYASLAPWNIFYTWTNIGVSVLLGSKLTDGQHWPTLFFVFIAFYF
jgi:hypothetical protein